ITRRTRHLARRSSFAHPDSVDPPESLEGTGWIDYESIGATQVGSRRIQVYIANRTDDPIMITDIGLQVEHAPTSARTVFVDPAGDSIAPSVLSFDLDEDHPVARQCETKDSFFEAYKVEIAPRTVEAFEIGIESGSCWCEVRLDIEYWHQDQWATETYPPADRDPVSVVSRAAITGVEQVHYGYQFSNDGTTYHCDGMSLIKCSNSFGFGF
ncbi:hypothetical protein, partial [Glycomyces salinus]|uniref:hypothetical protein n=1 Tax=Glycomyces salinus TaxID=980294 RepID=UPI001E286A3D